MFGELNLYDAQQALTFLRNQQELIEPEVYGTQYSPTQYQDLVPVDTSAPEWVQVITFYALDRVGQAEWFHSRGKDIPYADINRDTASTTIGMAGIGYDFDLEEIAQARQVGINLPNERAASALLAYDQFLDNLALYGDTAKGMVGLTNDASVTSGLAPNDGAGALRTFASKTPTQILRDLNALLGGIYISTNTIELSDTLLMSLTIFNYLATTPRSDNSDETILEYLLRANVVTVTTGRPLKVRAVRGLDTAGAGATQRIIAYRFDKSVLKFHLPMPHRFLPAYQSGPLIFNVPGIFRTGGTEIRRKAAVRYLDGV
jgi:hypothetical protein